MSKILKFESRMQKVVFFHSKVTKSPSSMRQNQIAVSSMPQIFIGLAVSPISLRKTGLERYFLWQRAEIFTSCSKFNSTFDNDTTLFNLFS